MNGELTLLDMMSWAHGHIRTSLGTRQALR
jgi:hypothetical protein